MRVLSALPLLFLLLSQGGRASIEGRVLRRGSSDPVIGATVLLAKIGGQLSDYRTAVTDGNGAYALRTLAAGRYRVYAQSDDYVNAEYGQTGNSTEGTAVEVGGADALRDINISLTPTAVITGRVRDADGNPAPGIYVYALQPRYVNGERTFSPIQPIQRTNDLGEYRLFGLTPGVYFVSAVAMDVPRIEGDTYVVPSPLIPPGGYFRPIRPPTQTAGAEALLSGLLDPAAFAPQTQVETFYPGVTNPADALGLDLAPAAVARVDLALRRVQRVKVQGRVVHAATGQLAADVSVSLVRLGPNPSTTTVRSQAGNTAGVFQFPSVAPGAYEVRASSGSLRARTVLEVGDRDVENLPVALVPSITIQGRVLVDGRNARSEDLSGLTLQLLPGPLRSFTADGTVSIDGLAPGDYELSFLRVPNHLYVNSLTLGGLPILTAKIRIDRDPGDLQIGLSTAGGSASGLVLDAAQRPVAGARVVFVPAASLRTRFDLYRAAATDSKGRWEVQGLAPGDYKVFAWERMADDAWQDPAILVLYESSGIPQRVSEREKYELRLTAISDR